MKVQFHRPICPGAHYRQQQRQQPLAQRPNWRGLRKVVNGVRWDPGLPHLPPLDVVGPFVLVIEGPPSHEIHANALLGYEIIKAEIGAIFRDITSHVVGRLSACFRWH